MKPVGLHVIVLAAGQGRRMASSLPKVLHRLAGKPLLEHVLNTARQLQPECIHIVYGYGGEAVKSCFDADDIQWVYQKKQLGTGHAVQLALQGIDDDQKVCVQYGDVPLLRASTLAALLAETDSLGILTAKVADATGYGRVIRDSAGQINAIIEDRDADGEQKKIREINTGIIAGKSGLIKNFLSSVGSSNHQREMYLTDIVAIASESSYRVNNFITCDKTEFMGINDKVQLAAMERIKQQQIAENLMYSGVTLYDPARLDVRGELICGKDVEIDINCLIEGRVELADGVVVGPNVYLKDCVIGADTFIQANCVIEGATIAGSAIIGPFSRIRPGTRLGKFVRIGNFVEIKNSEIDEESKINHLSYIGDSCIGKQVNIGAGVITCNYDGVAKHKTTIKDNAFVGSGSELVAPIQVGQGSTIGAGSTLSRDIDDGVLAVERSKVRIVKGWQRVRKQ